MPITLSITPHGRPVFSESTEGAVALPDPAAAKRIAGAFERGSPQGLLHLATTELQTPLPAAFGFARDFARNYLTRLCHTPDLDGSADLPPVPAPQSDELEAMAGQAPLMRGLEYLTPVALAAWWAELDALVRDEIRAFSGGAQAYLREKNPLWRLVGRVTFHLAENKRDPNHPFAFMATYASRLSAQGRVQHLPLGRALQEYAGERNRSKLLALLTPIQRASERSEWAKELADSGDVYHPLAWSARQAYRFLQEIPVLEESGLIVRVPDWWKANRPPRPMVSVRVGEKAKSRLGADALLDFSVGVTLGGEPLSEQELHALLESSGGLVALKGKWVEVDREKLEEALKHWKSVEREAREGGISFFEGMRLLSGASLAGDTAADVPAEAREWTGISAGDALEKTLRELRDPDSLDRTPQRELRAELRPYQQIGVNWLRFLTRLGLGACLADDMGLGKTIQVIALLLHLRRDRMGEKTKTEIGSADGEGLQKVAAPAGVEDPRPGQASPYSRSRRPMPTATPIDSTITMANATSLLVVPASLIANWRSEMVRFAPSISVFVAHPSEMPAGEQDALTRGPALTGVDLVITTYGMLSRLDWLRERQWALVVLDEAQAIKNPGTRQTKAAKQLKGSGRIALTGTPVENRLGDLWSLFDFLNPGLLGTAKAFSDFVKGLEEREQNRYGPLRTLVKPYILRRLKTDKRVIADLPDKTEVNAYCGLSKRQAALYEQSVRELAKALDTSDGIQRRGIVLAYLMRFKQICNHPSQLSGDGAFEPDHSGKFQRLRDLCEELAERQEKALIFTQFREIAGPLADFLADVFGRPGLVLHGQTPVAKRRGLVEAFQRDDGPPFFVLSLKAGGTGLNLTAASHVIHFDRWWNPAVENQATDRAFRIGQKRNVLVHRFVCRGTVEDRIDEMIAQKAGLSRDLLDQQGGEVLLTEMDNEQLLRFVALDINKATET